MADGSGHWSGRERWVALEACVVLKDNAEYGHSEKKQNKTCVTQRNARAL